MRTTIASAIVIALTAGAPRAEPVSAVSVSYNIDVGPLTVTEVSYELAREGEALRSQARIRSRGISRIFSEYSARAEAESRAEGSEIAPRRFTLLRQKDDRLKRTALEWTGEHALAYSPQEKKPERRARIDGALTAEVADPMTAVLRIGTAGQEPCPSVQRIFDGRDVYELTLADKGFGELKDGNGYRGLVKRCSVSWTPIAGRAAEKNEPRDTYEAAFAPAGELPSGRTLWLPVVMSGKLKGLRFNAYATSFAPQPVQAESQAVR